MVKLLVKIGCEDICRILVLYTILDIEVWLALFQSTGKLSVRDSLSHSAVPSKWPAWVLGRGQRQATTPASLPELKE